MTRTDIMEGPFYNLFLEGKIVTESPVCIVAPNAEAVQIPDEDGKPAGKASKIASLVRYYGGERRCVAVLPASSLRGKLRHAAVAVVLRHLPEKPGYEDYVGAALGGVKNSDSEDSYSLVSRDARRAPNPLLGIFGGASPSWDPSRAHIEAAIPGHPVEPMLVAAVRTDVFAREPGLVGMLDPSAVADYLQGRSDTRAKVAAQDDLGKALAERARLRKAGDEGGAAAMDAKVAALSAKAEAAKDEAGNSLLMPHAHFAIPIGAEFDHRIVLNRVTSVEIGLFLEALDEMFLNSPVIGGKANLGYGRVRADWEVSVRDGGARAARPLGTIAGRSYQGISAPDGLDVHRDAWRDFAASGALSIAPVRTAAQRKAREAAREDTDAGE